MSVTITLHVYSGRPDPAWEITDDQALELARMLQAAPERTLAKPPGVAGPLGYRGFTIDAIGERRLERQTLVHGGIADIGRFDLSLHLGSPEVEKFLLETAGEDVNAETRDFVLSELEAPTGLYRAEDFGRRFVAPPYNPGKWNNDAAIRTRNNCYNYASDKITNTFAQPGRGTGQMYTALTCGNVGPASQRDGQIPVSNPNQTPAQGQIVCLVMWPGNDFHWYRRDSNNMWSHKPGQTPARNTDNSGNPIPNPETCNRGPYTQVCGYYNSIPAQTRIN